MTKKFLRYKDFQTYGIGFSRAHVDRLQRAGRFPKKIHLGKNTTVYSVEEIESWLQARCAERTEAVA